MSKNTDATENTEEASSIAETRAVPRAKIAAKAKTSPRAKAAVRTKTASKPELATITPDTPQDAPKVLVGAVPLLFQAPDLPTPSVDPRSGRLKEAPQTASEVSRSREKQSRDSQARDGQSRDSQARDKQSRETSPSENHSRDNQERELQPRDTTSTEPKRRRRVRSEESTAAADVEGATRVDAKRQRRRDTRDSSRRRGTISESEFLARRESVDRKMIVREAGDRVQIGVLEDGILVEHYVAEAQGASLIGNIFLGRVQNVLPSMEAAFVDIGKGRNAVLYSGEVDWEAAETGNQPRRIELALKTNDQVLVQITKDPVGQKGARLTSQISLPGRYLVYVPGGSMNGISRKLPDKERTRLKGILKELLPEDAGVIVRTAAEGATEEQLTLDVQRLTQQWDVINKKVAKGKGPTLLHSEPDLLVKIIRDVFNEDFQSLVISGEESWQIINDYLGSVAPDLVDRISKYEDSEDIFDSYFVGDQIVKALDRKVYLPSGGSLVIDRTEAMTVVDVNTGKFIGSGGNLEETVTKNNLEAAEELVRQLRLRDIGGIVVIDFIDMMQESNRESVQRRLMECLSRDRTKHQVAEVTSLGLVQMTRKKLGVGLLESFGAQCDCCAGRGMVVTEEPKFKIAPIEPRKKRGKRGEEKQERPVEQKKIVSAEQAAVLGSVVNRIHGATESDREVAGKNHAADEALEGEPESKTELLNIVLDSLPEPAERNERKPRRRRASSGPTQV